MSVCRLKKSISRGSLIGFTAASSNSIARLEPLGLGNIVMQCLGADLRGEEKGGASGVPAKWVQGLSSVFTVFWAFK